MGSPGLSHDRIGSEQGRGCHDAIEALFKAACSETPASCGLWTRGLTAAFKPESTTVICSACGRLSGGADPPVAEGGGGGEGAFHTNRCGDSQGRVIVPLLSETLRCMGWRRPQGSGTIQTGDSAGRVSRAPRCW